MPSHVHEDIRLALGWSATLIAFAAAYYGYRSSFEQSKLWVTGGVVLCVSRLRGACEGANSANPQLRPTERRVHTLRAIR